ncbi:MAG: hypothetical protein LBV32_04375 [Tannerellaceae bacterium]|nr:hypothetical protein [Tannerellaceae bacterium]
MSESGFAGLEDEQDSAFRQPECLCPGEAFYDSYTYAEYPPPAMKNDSFADCFLILSPTIAVLFFCSPSAVADIYTTFFDVFPAFFDAFPTLFENN